MKNDLAAQKSVLADLLSLWQRFRAEGKATTPAELCRDHPELLPELQRLIAALEQRNPLADAGAPASPLQKADDLHLQPVWVARLLEDVRASSLHKTEDSSSQSSVSQSPPKQAASDSLPTLAAAPPSLPAGLPQQLGRYRVTGELGSGGFGAVYKGYDEQLQREVAIKVPHRERIASVADSEAYLTEARTLASLDHPGIVPVYDVGRTEDGLCYLVSKFVEGGSLATRIALARPATQASVEIVIRVALALHHAHQRGLVHRDIKPANILIDTEDRPVVADFGLALRDEDFGKGPTFAGTPYYMSPEQARREGHRVDARSDVYSLAVVLYELLTGHLPFRSRSLKELLDLIKTSEPRPPRQVNEAVPKELDRICLKGLALRASDRYSTARDFAEDLEQWLLHATTPTALPHTQATEERRRAAPAAAPAASTPQQTGATSRLLASPFAGVPAPTSDSDRSSSVKVFPKGLRSFDADDADFFLHLLPGPHDRNGLPESVRFWKVRLEERDPDKTFSVGLLFGPSGCGKSSLMKAGILPRLADHVQSVYAEATPAETEARLQRAIRRVCPTLEANESLTETMARLRRGQGLPDGKKLVVILDQFEQWLHARSEGSRAEELVDSLRQCDGQNLQCVLMVRDDFGMAATRFLRELEVPILEGQNFATADLFDMRHARKVLTEFGRAFGCLPDNWAALTREQNRFLDRAIEGLAQDGRVISVRLALFAEMMKGKDWTPETLQQFGGTEGIGIAFLEEMLGARSLNPVHRLHERAARAVLKALLPEPGTDLKGHWRSRQALLEFAGYAKKPADFDELMRILDTELRLITPIDSEDLQPTDGEAVAADRGQLCYQLTHDYLVPTIREWLTRKQKATRQGRAELLLHDRATHWNRTHENRLLPSPLELLSIAAFTRAGTWSAIDRAMMRKAVLVHGRRFAVALALVLTLFLIVRLSVRLTPLEQYLKPGADSTTRLQAFQKLDLDDEETFTQVVHRLDTEHEPALVETVLAKLTSSVQKGPQKEKRRKELTGALHELLKAPALDVTIQLAAFQAIAEIEEPIPVLSWLSVNFGLDTIPELRQRMMLYVEEQAKRASADKDLREAILQLTQKLLKSGPAQTKPNVFQVYAQLSTVPEVLKQIGEQWPPSRKDPLAAVMREYIRNLDLPGLEKDSRQETLREMSAFIARHDTDDLVSACVSQYDKQKPDDLCTWLMKAHESEDVAEAVQKSLACYAEATANRPHLKRMADYIQGEIASAILDRPVQKIRCSYALEYWIQSLCKLKALNGGLYPEAFTAVSKMLTGYAELETNEILPAVINAYVSLRPSETVPSQPLRSILKENRIHGIRRAAALGLGALHDRESLPLLAQIASNPQEGPVMRADALESLGMFGDYLRRKKQSREKITEVLLPILTHPAETPERAVVESIHTFGKAADPSQAEVLFPLMIQREWNVAALSALQTILLNDPQGCVPAVRAYLKWRVKNIRLNPGGVYHDPDSLLLGLTVPPAPSSPAHTQEETVKTIVRTLAEAHRDDSASVRRLASTMLAKLLQVPEAPHLLPDADDKTRTLQVEKWNQWWRTHSSKLHLFQGILIYGTEGS